MQVAGRLALEDAEVTCAKSPSGSDGDHAQHAGHSLGLVLQVDLEAIGEAALPAKMTVRTLQTQDEAGEVSVLRQDHPAAGRSPHPRLTDSFYTTQWAEKELGIRWVGWQVNWLLTFCNER